MKKLFLLCMIALFGVSCDKEKVPQSPAEKMELAIANYKDYNVGQVVELLTSEQWNLNLYGSLNRNTGKETVGHFSDWDGLSHYNYRFYRDGSADALGEQGVSTGPEYAFVCEACQWEFDATTRQLALHYSCRYLLSGDTFEFESVYRLIGLSNVCLILEVDSSDRRSRYLYEPFNG